MLKQKSYIYNANLVCILILVIIEGTKVVKCNSCICVSKWPGKIDSCLSTDYLQQEKTSCLVAKGLHLLRNRTVSCWNANAMGSRMVGKVRISRNVKICKKQVNRMKFISLSGYCYIDSFIVLMNTESRQYQYFD